MINYDNKELLLFLQKSLIFGCTVCGMKFLIKNLDTKLDSLAQNWYFVLRYYLLLTLLLIITYFLSPIFFILSICQAFNLFYLSMYSIFSITKIKQYGREQRIIDWGDYVTTFVIISSILICLTYFEML